MDQNKIQEWSRTVDESEESYLIQNLPKEAKPGDVFNEITDGHGMRKWVYVEVTAGSAGARWAYWKPWLIPTPKLPSSIQTFGMGANPSSMVIVDKIFNGDSPNFVGMLPVPYPGKTPGPNHRTWVLVSPRMPPNEVARIYEEKARERYEKSNEEYDVNTHTTKKVR